MVMFLFVERSCFECGIGYYCWECVYLLGDFYFKKKRGKMIKFYGCIFLVNVQLIVWCMEELGIEYECLDVGGFFGGNDMVEFFVMNFFGFVLVFEDNGGYILEVMMILCYFMC